MGSERTNTHQRLLSLSSLSLSLSNLHFHKKYRKCLKHVTESDYKTYKTCFPFLRSKGIVVEYCFCGAHWQLQIYEAGLGTCKTAVTAA